jgi:hypothetical protein
MVEVVACRAPSTTSESGKNVSGQEAFGSKGKEEPVEQLPAVSAADVTSLAAGVGGMTAFAAEKDGASAAPPAGGEQDNLCMADPQPALDPQAGEVGRANVGSDNRQCLYAEPQGEHRHRRPSRR